MNSFFLWLKSLFSPKPAPASQPTQGTVGNPPPVVQVPVVPAPKPTAPPIHRLRGADLSHFEPAVDWKQYVATDHAFAIAKASDGLGSKDSSFDIHRENAHKNNVPFFGYHFFRFGGMSPIEQAKLFYNSMVGFQGGEAMCPALDYEWDNHTGNGRYADGKETDAAGNNLFYIFASEVEQRFGCTPLIYTAPSFMPMKDSRFSRFKLWVFDYHHTTPSLPPSWQDWLFWQYTNKDPVPGTGKIDMNYFNGDLAALSLLVKK